MLTGPGETALTGCPAAELLRQRLGQIDQRRLGRAVIDHARVGLEERVDRRDVDDRAAAMLDHRGSAARVARTR